MMNKLVLLLVLVGLFVVSCDTPEDAWTIQGNSVYVNDSKIYINVTPHTAVEKEINIDFYTKSYTGGAYMMFRSNISQIQPVGYEYWNPHTTNTSQEYNCNAPYVWNYTSNPIHMYCWDTSLPFDFLVFDHVCDYYSAPLNLCGWYEIEQTNWSRVPGEYTVIPYNQGNNTHVWLLDIETINAQQLYNTRIIVNTKRQEIGQPIDPAYKYDWGIMPDTYPKTLEGIMRALEDENIYYIDPWTRGTTGMLAYYNLNETSNTSILDSHGTRHGILDHNAVQNSSGKISYATTFDGNADDITFAGTALTDTVGSIAFWAYNDIILNDADLKGIMGSTNNLLGMSGSWSGTFAGEVVYIQVSTFKTGWTEADLGGEVAIGWHHYVLVFNSTTVNWHLYLDGSYKGNASLKSGTAVELAAQDITLGVIPGNDAYAWDGTMDEIGFWSDELTAAEASWLYHSGTGISYPFTEAASNLAPEITSIESTNQWEGLDEAANFTATDDHNNTIRYSIQLGLNGINTNASFLDSTLTNNTEETRTWAAATLSAIGFGTYNITLIVYDTDATPLSDTMNVTFLYRQDNIPTQSAAEYVAAPVYTQVQEINSTAWDERDTTFTFDISILKDGTNQTSLYRTSTMTNNTKKSLQNITIGNPALYNFTIRYWDAYNLTPNETSYTFTSTWGTLGGKFNMTAQNITGAPAAITHYWSVINGTNYSTINGTINTNMMTVIGNRDLITIQTGADNYTTITQNNWNITHPYIANLTATLPDTLFRIYAYNATSGTPLTTYWAYILTNATNYTTTNGTIITTLNTTNNGSHLIDIQVGATGYNNTNETNYNFSTNYNASLQTLTYDYHKDIIDKAYFNTGNETPSGWTYFTGTGQNCNYNYPDKIEGNGSLKMNGTSALCYPDTNFSISSIAQTFTFFAKTDTSKVTSFFYPGRISAGPFMDTQDWFGFGQNNTFLCKAVVSELCAAVSYLPNTWYYFEYQYDSSSTFRRFIIRNSTGGMLVDVNTTTEVLDHALGTFYRDNSTPNFFVDRVLSWNGTSAQNPEPYVFGEQFQVYAYNASSGIPLTTFWSVINGTNYSTINGTINTAINKGYNGTSLINITVGADGFNQYSSNNYNFSTNLNASMGEENLMQVTFKNEETAEVITNETIYLEVISNNYSNSYIKPHGSSTLSLASLQANFYTLRHYNENYTERYYYFNLSTGSAQNLTLYVANTSVVSNVTATIYTNVNSKVEGAYIRVLRYFISTNSFEVVEIVRSDFLGTATMHLQLYDELYKFYIYYPYDVLRGSSLDANIVTVTSLNFQISIDQAVLSEYDIANDIVHSLTYNNATDVITLSFSTLDGLNHEVCLRVTKQVGTGNNVLSDQCLDSSAGTLTYNGTILNDTTYVAYGYMKGSEHGFASIVIDNITEFVFGLNGIFMTFLLVAVLFFIGVAVNATAGIILGSVGFVFALILGFLPLSPQLAVIPIIVAIIIGFMVRRGD